MSPQGCYGRVNHTAPKRLCSTRLISSTLKWRFTLNQLEAQCRNDRPIKAASRRGSRPLERVPDKVGSLTTLEHRVFPKPTPHTPWKRIQICSCTKVPIRKDSQILVQTCRWPPRRAVAPPAGGTCSHPGASWNASLSGTEKDEIPHSTCNHSLNGHLTMQRDW